MDEKTIIARRVALEMKDGQLVNLGIGIPTLVVNHLPEGVEVFLQSENGIIGMEMLEDGAPGLPALTDAGGRMISVQPGACAFDSAMSFGLIRGGHLDVTVLGGLQVDEKGRLANWMVPGKRVPGMGGAMDLVTGTKRVIIAMQHGSHGASKIVRECTMPLTSLRRVDLVVTDLAVIEPTDDGLVLRETAPGVTVADVLAATEARLIVPEVVGVMAI